jgi:hypothetical protein
MDRAAELTQEVLGGESEPAEPHVQEAAPEEDAGAEAESDWQFNDEGDIADSFDTEGLADNSGADPEPGSPDLSAAAQGAVDDLLAGVDSSSYPLNQEADDPAAEIDDGVPAFELGGSDEPGFDLSGAVAESPVVEAEAEPAAAAEDAADDPANWDIFDQPSDSPGNVFSPPQEASSVLALGTEAGTRSEPRVGPAVSVTPESAVESQWKTRISGIAGWALVLILLVSCLVGGLTSQSKSAFEGTGHWQAAGFVADQIHGRWLDNAVVGPIYVITGRLGLDSSGQADARTRLQIQLVDESGHALDLAAVWIGPEIAPRILRESAPGEIQALQQSRAADLIAAAVGGSSFVAVVAEMPAAAARFQLQAVEAEYRALSF